MSNVPDKTIEKILDELDELGSTETMLWSQSAGNILRRHLQTDQPSLAGCDEAFEQWWKAYPRKIRKKKCLAIWRRDWKEDNLPGIVQMLATLEDQKLSEQWKKNLGCYTPHPQTYLNGAQWEDEVLQGPSELDTRRQLPGNEWM